MEPGQTGIERSDGEVNVREYSDAGDYAYSKEEFKESIFYSETFDKVVCDVENAMDCLEDVARCILPDTATGNSDVALVPMEDDGIQASATDVDCNDNSMDVVPCGTDGARTRFEGDGIGAGFKTFFHLYGFFYLRLVFEGWQRIT